MKRNITILFVQVLIETDLIQKESDDIGPYAELVSWKNRSTKFNFLLEQIKSPICRNACGILKIAKSKTLEVSCETIPLN